MIQKLKDNYSNLCSKFDEDIVVDLINELNQVITDLKQIEENITETPNDKNENKAIELYKKRLMLLHQSFSKFENLESNINSTTHSKEEAEKIPGIDSHIENLGQIKIVLEEQLPNIKKLENKVSKSGQLEISVLSFDMHILLLKILERSIRYQKSLSKLLYILCSLFIHLTYNGFCGEKDQEEEEAEGDNEGSDFDMADGTGMGEGKGMQNVSDQIEHEEQLEGLKDDQGDPDDEQQDQNDKNEDEKGFDMKNDFDGKNEEVEKKEEENMGLGVFFICY